MCVRFHTNFFCFVDCINKSSHLPSQDLPPNTKKSYQNFQKFVEVNCLDTQSYARCHYIRSSFHQTHWRGQILVKNLSCSSLLQDHDPLKKLSLKKQVTTSVQPKVQPSLQPREDVLRLTSASSLASDLLGKFDF